MSIATLEVDFSEASEAEILAFIRSIDETNTAELIGADADMGELRDWATKPVRAPQGGSTVKGKFFKSGALIRGAIADSLEDYVKQQYQTEQFTWQTVLDSRTGKLDRSLDDKVFDYDNPASPLPPLHPNCRCFREPLTKISL